MKRQIPFLLSTPVVQNDVLKKRAIVGAFEESGSSRTAFCAERGLGRDTLAKYIREAAVGVEAMIDRRHFNSGRPASVGKHHLMWAIAYQAHFPKAPMSLIAEELGKVCQREGWDSVNYFALRRALMTIPSDEMAILRDDGTAFFEKHFPFGRRTVTAPLGLVQMDATEVDAWCIDMETGEVFKPWLTGLIDAATRVTLVARVHRREPSAIDVLSILREAILPKENLLRPWFGVFEKANTDNAKIYNDANVRATMLGLGVDWTHSPRACSSANGKIERFFGTFCSRLCKRMPSYSGRPEAMSRACHAGAIPFPLLQGIVDRFIDTDYSVRIHSALGMSPWEAWNLGLENIKNLVFDVAGVSDLFRYPVKVDVRRGAVEIDNRTYKAPELSHHKGRQVIAMKDPDGHKQDIEIVWGAQSICWAKRDDGHLADDLNQARTARIIELRSMRKEAKAVLDVCPPTSSIPTTTERAVKQAIRKNKPARRAKIHPVKLEIESDERKS